MERYLEEDVKDKILTRSEASGVKKLLKRVKENEIVIYQTDKSGRMALTTPDLYLRQGETHATGDKKIRLEEVEEIQKKVREHIPVLNKVFNVGEYQSEKTANRAKRAKATVATVIPQLWLIARDHKPVGGHGLPKPRPSTMS